MRRCGTLAGLLLMFFASDAPVGAQNLLTNADFHTTTAPWSSPAEDGAWSSEDSLGCVDSGALQVLCLNQIMVEHPDCHPYSGPQARIALRRRGSQAIDGLLIGFRIETYSNATCTAGEASQFNGFSAGFPATFQPLASTINLPAGTQAVRITFQASVPNCPADASVFIDSLYFGTADRILEHDFENGSACPMSQEP